MHKYGLGLQLCVLDKTKNLVWNFVLSINQNLVFLVEPVVRQIDDANVLPQVRQLSASAVDYVRYFVGEDEFKILSAC